jgi:hypothetical protein
LALEGCGNDVFGNFGEMFGDFDDGYRLVVSENLKIVGVAFEEGFELLGVVHLRFDLAESRFADGIFGDGTPGVLSSVLERLDFLQLEHVLLHD